MEFGLLPKFSTPVEKTVEIADIRAVELQKTAFQGLFGRRKSTDDGLKPFFGSTTACQTNPPGGDEAKVS
jgi:hypothetical protein